MSRTKEYLKEWTLKDVRELHEFLQGEVPENFTLRRNPKLDAHAAFSIIYVLQEHFGAITDEFDLCTKCEIIYYNDYGWHFDDPGINLCDNCINEVVGYHISLESDEAVKSVKEWYESIVSDGGRTK